MNNARGSSATTTAHQAGYRKRIRLGTTVAGTLHVAHLPKGASRALLMGRVPRIVKNLSELRRESWAAAHVCVGLCWAR